MLAEHFSWSRPALILSRVCRGHTEKIFVVKWNPLLTDKLVTVGIKHFRFWQLAGKTCQNQNWIVTKLDSLAVTDNNLTDLP